MYLKFWGTRGSLPKPGIRTVCYGGNTTSIEIRSASGTLIIIDCGTGAHALGQELMASDDYKRGHILLSHTHWDHIQGIPFFAPLFVSNSEWDIYGPKGLGKSIQESLAGQMQHTYFPVSLEQLSANIHYHDLVEGVFEIDDIKITTHYLNHTMLTCGYRLEIDGVVVVYSSDHEPHSRKLGLNAEEEIIGQDRDYAEFLQDADLVIHDAQYTTEEYKNKMGWGHSPMEYAIKICEYAGVKKLILTHHDPLRHDDDLDKLIHSLQQTLHKKKSPLEIIAAIEGQELSLTFSTNKAPSSSMTEAPANIFAKSAILEQAALFFVIDPSQITVLSEAVQGDDIHVKWVPDPQQLRQQALTHKYSLILIEHNLPLINGLDLCRDIRKDEPVDQRDATPSIVIIAAQEDLQAGANAGVTDWLITPFSSSYARSKIHAWLLRLASRWIRASPLANEKERLKALQKLNILDTNQEERFDRITRLAAASFNMPIVYISFIDKNRQWFKSCVGLNTKETSREASFCSHVIYEKKMIIVTDTYQDERFADNPLVLHEPHIRFYAGCPLILRDGNCVGTLCLVDVRPRFFQDKDIQLLEDLRDLVVKELEHSTDAK